MDKVERVMANVYQFNEAEILGFFLVLLRVSAFLVSWPVLGSESVPAPTKILFSLVVSIILFPSLGSVKVDLNTHSFVIVWLGLREVMIGVLLGFLSRLLFFILSIGGEVISVSMGLSSAQLFNPAMGDRASPLDQFLVGLGILFFLAINGHHLFLEALRESFFLVPVAGHDLSFAYFQEVGSLLQELTIIGLKLASPVLISILFMNIAMAIVGRAVPQINVLVSSLPVNILVGFLILFISLPLIIWQMPNLIEETATQLFQMMKAF